jgi:hypothetical protein
MHKNLMKQRLSLLFIVFLLTNCNYFSSKNTFNINCKTPDIHEFYLQNDLIKFKIVGYLEEDATIYVQSFDPEKPDRGVWGIVELKKGEVNYERGFSAYEPQGRVIYIPKEKREIHSKSTKEHLTIYIETAHN